MRTRTWRPDPVQEAAESGGISRGRAYAGELTAEGRAAFADRGYLADPQRFDPATVRAREAVSEELAQLLPAEGAAQLFRAAYQGAAGMHEYRVPDLEAG